MHSIKGESLKILLNIDQLIQGNSRLVVLKPENDQVSYLVKAEPKIEPEDSLADLEGITDLLPIQTGIVIFYRSR